MTNHGDIGEITETGRGVDGQFSLEWTVPDFLSLSAEPGDRYLSPAFDACDGVWFFEMYPNGLFREDPPGYVHIFFCRMDDGPPKILNVTLGIRGPKGVENKKERIQEFSEDDFTCFWYTFCFRSELSDEDSLLMSGHTLTFSCDMKSVVHRISIDSATQTVENAKEAEVPDEEPHSVERQGTEELKESMKRLLESGKESDVVVKVQGKEFPAHRLLLQARSPVFEAMFSHDMVEKLRGVVTMEDCNAEAFPAFLEHVYTGSTGMISAENVFSLYAASEMYDLQTLRKACAEFVKKNLTVASFCDAITLVVKYDEKELIELATEFFCINSLCICKTFEWQIFLKENSTLGNELFIKAFSK